MTKPADLNAFDTRWFSTALRSIGDAVIATDDQGRVLFLNPVAEQLTGWSERSALGHAISEVFNVVNEVTRNPVEDPVGKVLATGRIVGLANHSVLISKDKGEVPVDDSAAPILDDQGRITGVILVFRDITERRRAEMVDKQLAAIVESSDDIIISKTLNGEITSWNRGAQQIFGYRPEEVIGRHVSMLMPPEAAEDTKKILDKISRGEKVDHYHTKRRCKDGRVIDVSVTVSPIYNRHGDIIGASKVGRDITREKRAEAERQEAERRKDEFLAMLAHELRNPLAAIDNAAQLFRIDVAEQDLDWATSVIRRQVKHLARLIDDLLDVSRISRGKVSLRKEPLLLERVVKSAVEAVRPLVEERRHRLDVQLAGGPLKLEADPLRLEQILVNLLTNAAKYTDDGGSISLHARRQRNQIVISVRDSGLGIPRELLPDIFELFVQGDRTMARSEGGLGIGLTLVRKLTEMHGGTVTASSEGPGLGSEFTVQIPALVERITDEPHPREHLPRITGGNGSRVLLVDDNIDSAKALAQLLKILGHEVCVLHNGSAAVEAARKYCPRVILLDIGLPDLDGYQVVREIRAQDCGRDALIIAISGYGQPEDIRKSREAGFDHHLVKPVDCDVLVSLFAAVGE